MTERSQHLRWYRGTAAERGAYDTDTLVAPALWFESDTGDVYSWTGSLWIVTEDRYTDAEAVAAILAADGPGSTLDADTLDGSELADIQSEIDGDISTHAADDDAHHVKYTDAEAQAAAAEMTFINSVRQVLWGVIEVALTWTAAQVFNAAVTINEILSVAASKSAALLSIDQQGAGDIAEFRDDGTVTVRIPDQGGLVLVAQAGGYQEIVGLLGYDSEKKRLVLQHEGHDAPVPVDPRNTLVNYIEPVDYT